MKVFYIEVLYKYAHEKEWTPHPGYLFVSEFYAVETEVNGRIVETFNSVNDFKKEIGKNHVKLVRIF